MSTGNRSPDIDHREAFRKAGDVERAEEGRHGSAGNVADGDGISVQERLEIEGSVSGDGPRPTVDIRCRQRDGSGPGRNAAGCYNQRAEGNLEKIDVRIRGRGGHRRSIDLQRMRNERMRSDVGLADLPPA